MHGIGGHSKMLFWIVLNLAWCGMFKSPDFPVFHNVESVKLPFNVRTKSAQILLIVLNKNFVRSSEKDVTNT